MFMINVFYMYVTGDEFSLGRNYQKAATSILFFGLFLGFFVVHRDCCSTQDFPLPPHVPASCDWLMTTILDLVPT
jgi:hypothetical protein